MKLKISWSTSKGREEEEIENKGMEDALRFCERVAGKDNTADGFTITRPGNGRRIFFVEVSDEHARLDMDFPD